MLNKLDPEILADLAIIGKAYVLRGAYTLKKFTEKLVAEFGEGARKHAAVIYERSVELAEEAQEKLLETKRHAKAQAEAASAATPQTRAEKGEQHAQRNRPEEGDGSLRKPDEGQYPEVPSRP
jgi:hypothetical protein